MGIFSSKKKTYVTSVAYPLGEDDGEHTPYLQYMLLNSILQKRPIAQSITQGYLYGQGMSLRSAFKYAQNRYTDGVPESNVAYSDVPNLDAIRDILSPNISTSTVRLFHFNGINGATTTTDETDIPITLFGNAQLATSAARFGTTGLLLDGAGDYALSEYDSGLDFGTGDFCLEGSITWNVLANAGVFHMHPSALPNAVAGIALGWATGSLHIYANNTYYSFAFTPTLATPYHWAFYRVSGVIYLAMNGVILGSVGASLAIGNNRLWLGAYYSTSFTHNGSMDEVRVTKGLGVYPTTGTFPVPISEFQIPTVNIEIIASKISSADFFWWGDQFLAEKYGYNIETEVFTSPPPGVDVNALVAYDVNPDNSITILLINNNNSTYTETFVPIGLSRMKDYVHVAYKTVTTTVDPSTSTTRAALPGEVNHTTNTSVVINEYITETTNVVTTIAGSIATDVTTKVTVITSRPLIWMYQLGLGTYPVIDLWFPVGDLGSPYFPSVPLRVDNVDFTDTAHQSTELYKTGKKLLRRVGLDVKDIGAQILVNPNIADVDYAYVVFGINLNAKSQECKRYVYRFLEHLQNVGTVTEAQFNAWSPGSKTSPPTNVLKVFSEKNRAQHHDIEIQWQFINTTIVTGVVSLGAKPGTVTIEIGASTDQIGLGFNIVLDKSVIIAKRQIDADTYSHLEIAGLTYENFIYNGKSVIITSHESLETPPIGQDEEEGFILPLNYEILRNTPMVEMTDLAYQCNHLVFNCYKIVKQKWYQSGIFKFILIIIAIVITIATWGSTAPLWLATLAGGTALGIALAATLYVLGMMIIMNIIAKVAVQLFGEKWGALIAVIIAFVAMNWNKIVQIGQQIATKGLSSVITASNVMQATVFVSNAAGAYAQGQMAAIQKEALGLQTEFDKQMKEIEELTKANLSTNLDMIDIQGFMDATYIYLFESPDSFLTRTLLTGSDVCEITAGFVTNYTEVGLRLPTS